MPRQPERQLSRNYKFLLVALTLFLVAWAHVNFSCVDDSCFEENGTPELGIQVRGSDEFSPQPYPLPPNLEEAVELTDYCKLPRSSTRDYNTLFIEEKKYMMYSPAGGFNNQLMELLNGIILAKMSNRDLIVSVDGRHEHGWYTDYRKIPLEGTAPLDAVVDFEYLEKLHDITLIPLNVTNIMFEQQLKAMKNQQGQTLVYTKKIPSLLHPPHRSTIPSVETALKQRPEPVVSVFGGFYTEHWIMRFPEYWQNVRYSPYLRQFALALHARKLDNPTGYSAFHIRLGDYAEDGRTSKTSIHYLNYAKKVLGLPRNRLIFIATDSNRNDPFFKVFLSHYKNVVFSKDLYDDEVVGAWFSDFEKRIASNELRNDILGLVEQMLCVIADTFLGTSISTFSRTIVANRVTMNMVPELQTPEFEKNHYPRVSAMMTFHGVETLFRVHRTPTHTETLRDKRVKGQRGKPY